jgi:hypothetical protein
MRWRGAWRRFNSRPQIRSSVHVHNRPRQELRALRGQE